jgi:hypothetical protein
MPSRCQPHLRQHMVARLPARMQRYSISASTVIKLVKAGAKLILDDGHLLVKSRLAPEP